MKYGVIDIGTNTIRAVIYNVDKEISEYKNIAFESEILLNTVQNKLTEHGIKRLIITLNKALDFFSKQNITTIFAFATSAMRDVVNFDEINNQTNKQCKINIELLSEQDEMLCDYYSLKYALKNVTNGVGMDLGGGSCQVITFFDDELKSGKSLPIGVKRLFFKFGDYCEGIIPDLRTHINNELKKLELYPSDNLYLMGGTAKSILKIIKSDSKIKTAGFSQEQLEKIFTLDLNEKKYASILHYRTQTIKFGAEVIYQIAKRVNAKNIIVLLNGSREGYVIKNILRKGSKTNEQF